MDLYEKEIKLIDDKTLVIHALCRNDKKILKYSLTAQLYGDVQQFGEADPATTSSDTSSSSDDIFDQQPTASKVKDYSAGRVQVDLVKADGQRWKSLFAAKDQQKYQRQLNKWWDKIESKSSSKDDDDDFSDFDTGLDNDKDDDIEDIFAASPSTSGTKKKKSKKKSKKSKGGKKGKKQQEKVEKNDGWLGNMRKGFKDLTGI